jgi:hypothetical protein
VVFCALLLLGGYLRVNRFLLNRSLWLDESYLALNIIERTPAQLLGPLAYGQVAPVGFLLPVKLLSTVLGPREQVLRLIPLLSGLASLLLFYHVARRWLPNAGLVLALTLFSVSDSLADYAAQFKQYSSDALITLVLLATALWFVENKTDSRRYLVLALGGSIAVWISHPAAIVLAGIGMLLILLALQDKAYAESLRLAGVAACWLASFAITFVLSIRNSLQAQSLLEFWLDRGGFVPFPPRGLADIEMAVAILVRPFEDPLGFAAYSGAVLLFAIGVIDVIRKGRSKLLLLTPLVVAVGLSALRLYPFALRLLLYAVPLLLLIMVDGTVRLSQAISARGALEVGVALTVLGLVVFQPLRNGLARGLRPREREEIRPLLLLLTEGQQSGDVVAVYYAAQYAYRYYSYLLDTDLPEPVVIQPHGDAPEQYYNEVEQLQGNRRVWVVFAHTMTGVWGSERPVILGYLDDLGHQVEHFEETGASLYLYDLSGATPLRGDRR